MIGMLRGCVWEKGIDGVVLDVGGVGYEITVPARLNTVLAVGLECVLYTCLVVREDDMSLYGFAAARDKDLFLKLTGVTGVGPKAAMALLSAYEGVQLAQALAQGNHTLLTHAPGIGTKTAQRLVLELKGKFDDDMWRQSLAEAESGDAVQGWGHESARGQPDGSGLDVLDSLIALGFSLAEAKQAWKTVREADRGASTEEQVRAALRLLAKGK
ncbi:MAG: Holliday junction branch migration protein RuvA [Peptococcaceae bacterium]|nr:Holliday junction branch migration protein RuvA [Peptococcaceae bacterium]